MEPRTLLTATPTGITTFSSSVENAVIFNQNSFMAVLEASHGTSSYGFPQWHFLEFGDSTSGTSAVFDSNNTGASDVNSASFQFYNTVTSGNFHPYAGSFSVYAIPDDTISGLANSGLFRNQAGQVGAAALGTTSGGPATIGITGTANDWLIGTFSITTALPLGYSTFTGSTTGSTASGTGTAGSAAVLGSMARATIAADLNNHTPLRFAVVANDTAFAADWEGNFTRNQPQLTLDINQAPAVYFDATTFASESTAGLGITTPASSGTYFVPETDQVPGNTTTATININRTTSASVTTKVHWAITDGTAHFANGDYIGPTSGDVTFNPGDTTMPITVTFSNITTTDAFRTVNLTLTDPGQTGGDPAPVFPNAGNTATVRINYLQAVNVVVDSASYSVNEADGTATFTASRSGSGVGSLATDVSFSTADGLAYSSSPTQEQNALAGRDYGIAGATTPTTGMLHWNAGDSSSKSFTVPLLDVKTFTGTRTFAIALSNPSVGSALGAVSQATVTINDNTVTNSDAPMGITTHSSGVETSGPFSVNSFIALASAPHGSQGFADMPVITFGAGSSVFPTSYATATVDSVRLSIYNTATTGGFGGAPGSFDVYLLTDNSVDDSALRYQGGTGATGPIVIGTQASPLLLGTASFPNNQVGYNEYTFDNLSSDVRAAIASDLNSSGTSPIRFAITPSSGSTVFADWEGNFTVNQPKLSVLVEKSTAVLESFKLDVSSATVDKAAGTITVQVDRSSSGDLSDEADIHYATHDGTAGMVVGAPYNGSIGVDGTDYTGVTGTAHFNAGEDHTTFTISILDNPAIYGDKNFTVTIDSPSVTGPGRAANVVLPTTESITILDSRTVDLFQNGSDNATVRPDGPRTGASGKTYINIENAGAGTNASYGVIDFNVAGVLPFSPPSPVGTINQITLSTVTGFPVSSFQHNGTFRVYLVDDSTTDIQPGTSPLTFNTTLDPTEGLGSQLGAKHLLGTISYSAGQPIDVFSSFPLTDKDSATLGALANDLNTGAKFRIVVTPGDNAVAASWEGQFSFGMLFEEPILSFNYTPAVVAPVAVSIDGSSYSVNEADGTATFTVSRSGPDVGTTATDVSVSTIDGMPYASSLAQEQNALAGRDFGIAGATTPVAAMLHWNAGDSSSKPFTVPLMNIKTFAGLRSFTIALSDPSAGTSLGSVSQATVAITDNTVANSDAPTGITTHSSGIETTGPFSVNGFIPLASGPHGSSGFADMPVITFGAGSSVFPTTNAAATVDSVRLSIYNTATTGGFGGDPGSFDVYLLSDNSVPDSALTYQGGTGATGPVVIGTQAMPLLIGTASFPNNQVGYNEYTFDKLSPAASAAIAADLNSGGSSGIRFAITPSQDSPVFADWEGNFTSNQPKLSLVVEKSPAVLETFKLDVSSATVDKTAGTITIQVDRSSTGDLSDAAHVHFTTHDGTPGMIFGTPYNGSVGVSPTDYTGVTGGTADFLAGADHTTFTISIANNTAIFGDKNFTVTIDTPSADGAGRITAVGGPATELITIRDARTVNVFQNAFDNATVQPAGPRAGANGKNYVNVENAGAAANASYGVLDYNNSTLAYSPPSSVGTINEITLSTVTGFPVSGFHHSGTFNVYLVDDSTTDIQPGTSPLIFDTTADATEGLGSQLGTGHLLGTINYSSAQPTGLFTSFPLTNTDAGTLAVLKADLNSGTKFRVVVTPGDSAVAASWEGQFTSLGVLESPILSFNYTPALALPGWLDPASAATWNSASHLLTLTGTATIVGDPGSDRPVVNSSSTGTTLIVQPSNGDHVVHVSSIVAGSLVIGGSATNAVTVEIAARDANGNPLASAAPSSSAGTNVIAMGFTSSQAAAGTLDSAAATGAVTTTSESSAPAIPREFPATDRFAKIIDEVVPSMSGVGAMMTSPQSNELPAAQENQQAAPTSLSLQAPQSGRSASAKLSSLDAVFAADFSSENVLRWATSTDADVLNAGDDTSATGSSNALWEAFDLIGRDG